ncbi:MAG: ATP-binding protein [Candidatus Alkanophagales archaeon]
MPLGTVIGVSGKGGTGKTLVAALLIRELGREFPDASILAIDADPDSNLPDALGVSVPTSVGEVREALLEEGGAGDKRREFEGKIMEIMYEGDRYDLLVMGRPEGPGCYCPVNHIIRMVIDTLSKNYDYTVIDCEAGLEHLSRRTTRDVDVMLVVTDATVKGILTALRIRKLTEEIDIDVKKIINVANRIPEGLEDKVREEARKHGIEIHEIIPYDPKVAEFDLLGKPVVELPDDSPASVAVRRIMKMIVGTT